MDFSSFLKLLKFKDFKAQISKQISKNPLKFEFQHLSNTVPMTM